MSMAQSSPSRHKSLAGYMHHARVAPEERVQRSPMHAPVLVLNASYEPINVCAARRAIILVLKGVAMTEEENGHFLHAARVAMRRALGDPSAGVSPHPAPDARPLAQEHPAARPQHLPVLRQDSRRRRADARPRHPALARRASTWENLVACCHTCNRRKGNQLPDEANMKLMREPRAFNLHTSRHIMRMMGRSDAKWQKYLFY